MNELSLPTWEVTMPLLDVDRIDVYYGDIQVLKNVSFMVEHNEIVTLLGANGTGKSTTLRTISGLIPSRRGRIVFDGHKIEEIPAYQLPEIGLVLVPEGRHIFPEMSVIENLYMGAFNSSAWPRRECRMQQVMDLLPVLNDRKKQIALTLSGGEQQILAIGRALMAKPRLLMLDEPFLGLSPYLASSVLHLVSEIRKQEGTAILLIEQNAHLALSIADRGYVLQAGQVVLDGMSAQLLSELNIRQAYLGY